MHRIQQTIKWVVYSLLIINFVFYIIEDWDRALLSLNEAATWLDWTREFAVSIDEIAWFLLLFMFELETYALSDETLKGWVAQAIRGVRVFCFVLIAHTIYAYVVEIIDLAPTVQVEAVSELCEMSAENVSYVFNLEYTVITDENCSELSSDSEFFWRTDGMVVTDAAGLKLERELAWVDLFEAIVWLLIILAIEIVVRLQSAGITAGPLITATNATQLFLYLVLLSAAVWWATLSHWLYFWDELVWIGGFVAIEMNLSEWRDELNEEKRPPSGAQDIAGN